MVAKAAGGEFRLLVPLDASRVSDFKPDGAVKIVAFDAQGRAYEDVVRLDAKGQGRATLSFDGAPGNLHVVVGPEDATTEQMRGLQTISVDVARRRWGGKAELALAPIIISSYYWWWWRRWCRRFRITGVVRCADGHPVPGAKVCAYDVDWWWWWWSNQQVGCATTDENGAFEIDFTWCCGWWPWWWWRYRVWFLEPTLAERLSRLLKQELRVRVPVPGPEPDPRIFQALLGGEALPIRRPVSAGPSVRAGAAAAPPRSFDPASLEGLRKRLVPRLPRSPELERLRLWPWWPWWPWWDCTPDIIFRVTQNCQGVDETIVAETIWDARWDIATDLSITLVANDHACCVEPSTCLDGGDCAFISDICEDNLDDIGGNPGANAGAAQKGYLDPGLGTSDSDRPYSGTVPIRGCVGDSVDYCEVLVSTVGFAGPWSPLPTAAAGGLVRKYWDNALQAWPNVPFPFTPISDGAATHDVIESLPHWEANNGPKLWDAFTVNILMQLVTQNVLADGTYYLRLRGWTRPGYAGNLANPVDLPVCGSAELTGIVVTIDNHLVTVGPADLNGHPCGAGKVHVCTTEPDTEVTAVSIVRGATTIPVDPCSTVAINPTDTLRIDFVAYDPDSKSHLRNYGLWLHYDVDDLVDLLALPGVTLTSLAGHPWAPAAAQVGPDYAAALVQGAASPHWAGGAIRLEVNAAAAFEKTCCYLLELRAHKRVIGGGGVSCDHDIWNQYNRTEYSFTITV